MDDNLLDDRLAQDIQERLYFFALKSVHCASTAREITQDVMVSLVGLIRENRVRHPENLAGLAYGIMKNKLADHIREAVTQRQRSSPLDERCPGDSTDPSDRILKAQERRRLVTLVEKLKPVDRMILHLYFFENCSLPEIAHRLGFSPAWITLRKHRALKRLKKWMKEP